MKTQLSQHLIAALFGVALTTTLHAQTNAFTYQGKLTDNGSPANGFFDITFSVWNNASGPSQVGLTLTNNAVPVSDDLFTVTLDFGAGVFDGSDRWLDFRAAFGLGNTDTGIATVDADGVALAAIQGLNQKLEQKEKEITELQQQLSELRDIVSKLNQ